MDCLALLYKAVLEIRTLSRCPTIHTRVCPPAQVQTGTVSHSRFSPLLDKVVHALDKVVHALNSRRHRPVELYEFEASLIDKNKVQAS